jgi:hypothetical protein
MNENELEETLSRVAGQFFDVSVNPIAGMFCSFLALQVQKGQISKDEAKGVIASALDLINQSDHAEDVLSNGHDMLIRMIAAIDRLPKNGSSG